MITNQDLKSIDTNYFDIIEVSTFYLVLRSKKTSHIWHLLEQEPNGHRSFFIAHKHHATDAYHPQTCRGSIDSCCKYIKEHDSYHFKREEYKTKKRQN